jgi:type IV pilus assembly protein PilV
MNTVKRQLAFTLLEVMIALVIFSIGLLGLAGLQSAGIRNNQISYSRTVAQQLVYDMSDRIRNNRNVNYAAEAPVANDCVNGTCVDAALAAFDLFEWNAMINDPNSPLKNAVGFIEDNGNDNYTVSIGWDENLTGAVPTDCTPPTPAGIVCVSADVSPYVPPS